MRSIRRLVALDSYADSAGADRQVAGEIGQSAGPFWSRLGALSRRLVPNCRGSALTSTSAVRRVKMGR
jgi:hypothetical protein